MIKRSPGFKIHGQISSKDLVSEYLTKKPSSRMRTAYFCGCGGGIPYPPRYPTPRYLTPRIPYTLEGTWDQRYATPRRDMGPERYPIP